MGRAGVLAVDYLMEILGVVGVGRFHVDSPANRYVSDFDNKSYKIVVFNPQGKIKSFLCL